MKYNNYEILEKILNDTKSGKYHWYLNDNVGYFYSIRRIESKEKNTIIDIIFKASDNYDEIEGNPLMTNYVLYMDLYMSKNLKKAKLLFRIKDNQSILQDIMEEILKIYKKAPEKSNNKLLEE